MYDQNINEFLEDNTDLNVYISKAVFNQVESAQLNKKKSIGDFSKNELLDFYGLDKKIETLKKYNEVLIHYIDWCLKKGYLQNKVNYAKEIDQSRELDKIAKITDSDFYSIDQVEEFISYMINPVDKFIIYAIYNGIKGNLFVELALMKPEHINIENGLIELYDLDDNGTPYPCRTVKASKRLINYAMQSAKAQKYIADDGREYPLSGYVVKFKSKKNYNINEITPEAYAKDIRTFITSKFKIWKKYLEDVSSKKIYYSGLFNSIEKKALELNMSNEEILSRIEVKEILEQYNYLSVKKWFKDKINNI